jgi:hypothetical protein
MRLKLMIMVAVVTVVCWAGVAGATTTYVLNLENTDAAFPNNPAPFGKVNVTLTGSNTATVEFTTLAPSALSATNDSYIFVNKIGASVNGAFSVSDIMTFTETGTPAGEATWISSPNHGTETFDGFGQFGLVIRVPNPGSSDIVRVTFTLTKASGSWDNDAVVLALNAKGFHVAAHEATDFGGSGNTFYATDGTVHAPLPPSAMLLGSGLLGLGLLRRKRSLKK